MGFKRIKFIMMSMIYDMVKILIFTDQDDDGFHSIQGLLINYIHTYWPELLKINIDFIVKLSTPVIRASKGKIVDFYNLPDYHKWEKTNKASLWHVKYYKGLGTSNSTEAKEYFTDIINKLVSYKWDEESDDNGTNLSDKFIKLAFEKAQANNRKLWLLNKEK